MSIKTGFEHWNWSPERRARLMEVLKHCGMMMRIHDADSALEVIEKYALERAEELSMVKAEPPAGA